jgi:hypothetical protein
VTTYHNRTKIDKLEPNEVFVFGSNEAGMHAGGAAKMAVEKFGAIMGQSSGIQGQSYAIPTVDKHIKKLTLYTIMFDIDKFLKHAHAHADKTFIVTEIGCGIAGHEPEDIADLFHTSPADIPDNVTLPEAFK